MKGFRFLAFFACCLLVFGHPHHDEQPECKCKLHKLIPKGSLDLPDFDISENELPVSAIEDPLKIKNGSATLNEEKLRGTFALNNGVVEGLSTFSHDFNYDRVNESIHLNATLKRIRLTGLYEIIDGQANLTTLGHHTFSGQGILNASATGVAASLDLTLKTDAQTLYLSIADLKFSFNFDNAGIVAENLVIDGVPVEWETVNQNIRPIFEEFLQAQDVYMQLVQAEVNKLIECCTIMNLIELVALPRPISQQYE